MWFFKCAGEDGDDSCGCLWSIVVQKVSTGSGNVSELYAIFEFAVNHHGTVLLAFFRIPRE